MDVFVYNKDYDYGDSLFCEDIDVVAQDGEKFVRHEAVQSELTALKAELASEEQDHAELRDVVTALREENERLKAESFEELYNSVIDERDALREELASRNEVIAMKAREVVEAQTAVTGWAAKCKAAEQRNAVLRAEVAKRDALLDELGCPLDEVSDLFESIAINAKRYEWLRDHMSAEDFPAEHPDWSAPSEFESSRIDSMVDAALKPTESGASE